MEGVGQMSIKICIEKAVVYEDEEVLATITKYDTGSFEVVVKQLFMPDDWLRGSSAIYKALKAMNEGI